ncbi:hypothetical protein C0J52_23317 [Blattella germanica]|nr:hypothetical protein C0J52_23317 [Blattella germanica]
MMSPFFCQFFLQHTGHLLVGFAFLSVGGILSMKCLAVSLSGVGRKIKELEPCGLFQGKKASEGETLDSVEHVDRNSFKIRQEMAEQ